MLSNVSINKLLDRFLQLKKTERYLIIFGILGLSYAAVDVVYVQPYLKNITSLKHEISATKEKNQSLELNIAHLHIGVKETENKTREVKEELQRTVEHIATASAELEHVNHGIISRNNTPSLLRTISLKARKLKLLSLKKGSLVRLIDKNEKLADEMQQTLYKYPLEINIEGSYWESVKFIDELENLPWAVYWDNITLDNVRGDKTRLNLKLYALTTQG